MQERLIREMVKLRGGPTKLKALRKEYNANIDELSKKLENLRFYRDLIDKLTSDESEADADEPEPSEE